MTCEQMNPLLDNGPGGSMPPEAAEHLRQCERCQAILKWTQNQAPAGALPPNLQARIEDSVLNSLERVSPLPSTSRFSLGFLAIFAVITAAGIALMGAGAPRVMSPAQLTVVALILAGSAILLAISLSREMAPGAYHRNRLVCPQTLLAGVGPAFLVGVLLLFPWKTESAFLTRGLRCTFAGVALAAPAAAFFWLLLRRGAILSPASTGAAVGLLAGLAGALALHLGCPIAEAPHLAVWHVAVPIAGSLGGYLVGRLRG